jgi:hypothetical protein
VDLKCTRIKGLSVDGVLKDKVQERHMNENL